jgi:hypothetical protein
MPSGSTKSSYLLINPLSGSYSRALHDEILSSLQGIGISVARPAGAAETIF